MLFMERDRAPSEEEQFEVYREALLGAAGHPLIIRTIDLGGDKPVPHLNLPNEPNPYLGYRGMRIYAEHRELFCSQLRALVRASAFGSLQVMAPMVSTIEEVRWLKEQVADVQSGLRCDNVAFDPKMGIGIMIEVPSLAFVLDQVSREVDFFSIGTNDLNQYFLAVDRDNAKVAELSSARHPSFLRFLKHIVDGVHRCGKWVGICGEMAGDVHNLPILLGLGLDEISLAASEIPLLKEAISRSSASDCERLLERMMACTQVDEVEKLLEAHHPRESAKPLLDPGLMILASDSRNKEEALRELIDALYVAGRTDNPDRFEQVIWARETAYPTGVGHGFAIPHCRSEDVAANSIVILKLTEPIEWGSLDHKPVSTVILLAVRESDPNNTHMQVLSRMARKLMHEDFRQHLAQLGDSRSMLAYLARELDVS
jgi:fructose-specific PTS system IIA-like component